MSNKVQKKFNLFNPSVLVAQSKTFEIPFGGQVTVVAKGLRDNDYIEFEMVDVPGVDQDCACVPLQGLNLSVTNAQTLKYAGKPVRVTASNPVVILSAPQGVLVRAIRHVAEELNAQSLYVYGMTSQSMVVIRPYSGLDYIEQADVDDFTALDDATAPDNSASSYFASNPKG